MPRPGQTDAQRKLVLPAIDEPRRLVPFPPNGNKLPAPKKKDTYFMTTNRMKVTGGVGKIMQETQVKGRGSNNNGMKKNRSAPLKGNVWRTNSELR